MKEPNLTLTLTPNLTDATPAAPTADMVKVVDAPDAVSTICQELAQLSEEEQATVKAFSEQIDITDTAMVLHYGAAAQKHIADFSSSTLSNIRTKDMGDVGGMLSSLTVELRGFNFSDEEKKGIRGLFRRAQNKLASMKAQFDKVEKNVDRIVSALENHQVILLKDITMLDKMYDLNAGYFKELTMYILAGKQKLQHAQEHDLKLLQEKAAQTGQPEDAQAANDFRI